ncbi:uncharacterized protein LOC112690812 [Sipha flava]|uniref:Uncharacterized protein LOC112690812 n=1 Tax=Sipha flava TaxID=143950 RepID=A0A8B8GDD6_9HEMI|nr:uncharacterized protein LOC112690812 [Sipha flava]
MCYVIKTYSEPAAVGVIICNIYYYPIERLFNKLNGFLKSIFIKDVAKRRRWSKCLILWVPTARGSASLRRRAWCSKPTTMFGISRAYNFYIIPTVRNLMSHELTRANQSSFKIKPLNFSV